MYKVLIVEDDPMVAMINEQFVSHDGFEHRRSNRRLHDKIKTDEMEVLDQIRAVRLRNDRSERTGRDSKLDAV